jgi:uncharacterized protein (DUF4415 family)
MAKTKKDIKRLPSASKKSKATAGARDASPELGDDFFANALPHRGGKPRESISLRMNTAVLDYFKEGGKGWQTRMHAVLEGYVRAHLLMER